LIRRRGRGGDRHLIVRRGDRVIDGRIRARLLGLPLLDLDAHVVVATARDGTGRDVIEANEPALGAVRPVRADGTAPPELVRAVRLLAEGTTALDDARRLR
jgi:hypothetical protein